MFFLDEPTNDLDIATWQFWENFLQSFQVLSWQLASQWSLFLIRSDQDFAFENGKIRPFL